MYGDPLWELLSRSQIFPTCSEVIFQQSWVNSLAFWGKLGGSNWLGDVFQPLVKDKVCYDPKRRSGPKKNTLPSKITTKKDG